MADCKVADQCPHRGHVQLNRPIDSTCFWLCGMRPDTATPQLSEGRLITEVEYESVRFEYDPFDEGVKN